MTAEPLVVQHEGQPNGEYVIETHDVWRIYKIGAREVQALRGINLQIPTGHFIALKGRSGSGKTTLLNCLGGLDHPDKGVVEIFGRDLSKMDERALTEWRRKEVGFIFQSFGLLPTLSAYENVELMLRIARMPGKEKKKRTLAALEMVGLTRWMHHRPYELSGGQQQRVAIARAMVNEPKLILADEPTGELDSTTSREILGLIGNVVKSQGITVLMSSHDPLVDTYVDRIYQLRDGEIVS
jgi:ABC-type lipoprotein export system ATPase subunit